MRLQPILLDQHVKQFAGIWLAHDGSVQIHVAFTGDWHASTEEVRSISKLPELIVGHAAEHSLSALEGTQMRMVRERDALQRGESSRDTPDDLRATGGSYDLDIDLVANTLVLYADNVQPSSLGPELEARYGKPVRVVEQAPTRRAVCASRFDCRFEMRGGLAIDGSQGCSTAFVAHSFDSVRRFVLSAAHCGGNGVDDRGATRSQGGSYYGTVHGNFQSDRADVERIINDTSDLMSWVNHNPIFLNPGDYRTMTGYTQWAGIVVGTTTYGKSGRTTGNTQGFVQSTNFSPGYVPGGNRFIRTNMCIQPGDSGGAVYRQNNAVGVVSGYNNTACSNAAAFGIFGSIEYAIARANVNLSA